MKLLREYARQDSEAAFAELVCRHINLVYSAALRHVGIAAQAEEITQAVFVILARKSASLREDQILDAWLFETTRLTALSFLRGERRRQFREQEAYMQSILQESTPDPVWQQLAPSLDEAMMRLGRRDREAVVLRFFKGRSLGEVAAALNIKEPAAQKRVSRALEKLRNHFARRGVDSTAAVIGETISANSIQAAPVALAKAVTAVAIAKGATVSISTLTLIKGALKIMAWTKVKTAIVTAVIIVCVAGGGAGFYAHHSTHLNPAAELQAGLHIQRPATGTWSYPNNEVMHAMFHFGSNRADAFPILKEAALGPNAEAREQAVAAMGYVGMPARPKSGRLGEPSPDVVPLLWKILNSNDGELSSFALTSLSGIGFQPKDIPVLAALLVRSHGGQLSQKAMAFQSVGQMQKFLSRANNDQMLQRYIPETIATTIRQHPADAVPFISSVEDLLDDTNADVRFGAACALAEYKGVNDSKISAELAAGLKIIYDTSAPVRVPRPNPDGLKQLMAVETLQRVGPDAKSMIPALLEYAHSTQDKLSREHALAAIGYIDTNLRNTMPEVDQAVKNDRTFKSMVSPVSPK
jgi:RNA polymerase sigma factor (sigma-70 family)